jgi:uncharacterized integral membrane protein
MQRSLIFALLLILVVVIFALQNSDPISIKLFFWEIQSSIAFIMASVLFLGALLGVLFSMPAIARKREKIDELETKINATTNHASKD